MKISLFESFWSLRFEIKKKKGLLKICSYPKPTNQPTQGIRRNTISGSTSFPRSNKQNPWWDWMHPLCVLVPCSSFTIKSLSLRDKSFFRMDKIGENHPSLARNNRVGTATSNLRVVGPLKGRIKATTCTWHLRDPPPPPSTYNAATLPPPLEVSRIYLPRGWFKDSAKVAEGGRRGSR